MRLYMLANKGSGVAAELFESVGDRVLFPLANELGKGTRSTWILLAPFGRLPHSQGTQVFEESDAREIMTNFANSREKSPLGLPWYIGHPDHETYFDKYSDHKAYGRVKRLRVSAKGLEGEVTFSRSGVALANEEAFAGHSVNWNCIKEKDTGYYRPRFLKSVGWTNDANLTVPPVILANERHRRNETQNTMNKTIRDLLIKLGIIQPGASDDDVSTGVVTLANEVEELRTKHGTATTELANEKQEKASVDTKVTELETALANERTAHATTLVDGLITAGKLPVAKKDETVTALTEADDMGAKFQALANEAGPAIKTTSQTSSVAERSGVEEDSNQKQISLANEMVSKGQYKRNEWPKAFEAAGRELAAK